MPCFSCAKMVANSNVERIVASEMYVHTQSVYMLEKAGIVIKVME